MEAKVKFVKVYHHWKTLANQTTISKFDALHNFMREYDLRLWKAILHVAEKGDAKFIIKIPMLEKFDKPTLGTSSTVDRRVIDREITEALGMLGIFKPTTDNKKWMRRSE